jgi:hypothetical protein
MVSKSGSMVVESGSRYIFPTKPLLIGILSPNALLLDWAVEPKGRANTILMKILAIKAERAAKSGVLQDRERKLFCFIEEAV